MNLHVQTLLTRVAIGPPCGPGLAQSKRVHRENWLGVEENDADARTTGTRATMSARPAVSATAAATTSAADFVSISAGATAATAAPRTTTAAVTADTASAGPHLGER